MTALSSALTPYSKSIKSYNKPIKYSLDRQTLFTVPNKGLSSTHIFLGQQAYLIHLQKIALKIFEKLSTFQNCNFKKVLQNSGNDLKFKAQEFENRFKKLPLDYISFISSTICPQLKNIKISSCHENEALLKLQISGAIGLIEKFDTGFIVLKILEYLSGSSSITETWVKSIILQYDNELKTEFDEIHPELLAHIIQSDHFKNLINKISLADLPKFV